MLGAGIVHDGADRIGGVVELFRVDAQDLEAQTRLAEEALAPRRRRSEDQRRRRRGGRGWQDVQATLLPADADLAGRGQPLDERTQRVRRGEAERAGQRVEIGGMTARQRGQRVGLSGAGGGPGRQGGGDVGKLRRGREAARQVAEAFQRDCGGRRIGRRPRQDIELDVVGCDPAQPRGNAVGRLGGVVEARQDEDFDDQHAGIGVTKLPVAVEDGVEVETRVRTDHLPEGRGVPAVQRDLDHIRARGIAAHRRFGEERAVREEQRAETGVLANPVEDAPEGWMQGWLAAAREGDEVGRLAGPPPGLQFRQDRLDGHVGPAQDGGRRSGSELAETAVERAALDAAGLQIDAEGASEAPGKHRPEQMTVGGHGGVSRGTARRGGYRARRPAGGRFPGSSRCPSQ